MAMDATLKPILVRIAGRVNEHSETLVVLIKQKDAIENKQRQAKAGTVEVLSSLSQLVQEQIQFARALCNLCQDWNPISHFNDPVPPPISRLIRRWHRSIPGRVQQLTSLSASLVQSTKAYELAARELAKGTQLLHRDGVQVIESEMMKVKSDCASEAQRLQNEEQSLITARDNIIRMGSQLSTEASLLRGRLDDNKSNKSGLGFSVAGTGTGLASMGLLAVCPPVGAALAVTSFVSSMIGIGISGTKIAKMKKIEKEAIALQFRARQVDSSIEKLKRDHSKFVQDIEAVKVVFPAVGYLSEQFSPVKFAAEIMERTAIQRHSTSTSISMQVSGIQSTSTTLEMVTTHEHLIDCVGEILSDFSYHSKNDRVPNFVWDVSTSSLPNKKEISRSTNVKLEQLILSQDCRNLTGTVAVQNLAVSKLVTARYSLDNWKTVLEANATYNDALEWKGKDDGCDRFQFKINLDQNQNLETKVLKLCVRYQVSGNEYWDNNGGWNYTTRFTSQDLQLEKVLDKLVEQLEELKTYEHAMNSLGVIEERDDYQDILAMTTFEMVKHTTAFKVLMFVAVVIFVPLVADQRQIEMNSTTSEEIDGEEKDHEELNAIERAKTAQ